ncbi:related to Anopheles mitochondrial NADH dehydrogenase subunit 2 [Cephalotrichum gorgonifer]|uniref:Zinc transporter n=1 Tax=Cephalotrichum gorgonifer TaxID=2041049 RepID=A0AAE8MSN6_9PEZI|nr:related to Anopheles mitochondrial NADH dehydrogenase subunit 2 [Cephalotrichum gorgonifer]
MASDDPPEAAEAAAVKNPFNFRTQVLSTSPVKSNVGQRRGHKYKHSSISAQHQIFQEPPQRPPPILPASLPVPTVREAWRSMHRGQRVRLYWCLCHLAVAVFVFFRAEGSLALTALSHLVFFDAGSAAICVAVDVLGNFDVWRRSSIRHPFGLERAEVLAGFALSIFLLFGGFDLVSHGVRHYFQSMGDHEEGPGHGHHDRVSPGDIDWVAGLAILGTAISAYGLRNQARIAKVMRVSYLASMPRVLSNPFHVLTLFFSSLLLVLPLLNIPFSAWMDPVICTGIAVSMFALGLRLAISQGLMLLMSYGGNKSVGSVVQEIEEDPDIVRVEEAQFWQVHYGLGMANLKVRVPTGSDEGALSKLRSRIASLIQNSLGEGYGQGASLRWDVTIQMRTDVNT